VDEKGIGLLLPSGNQQVVVIDVSEKNKMSLLSV